MSRSSNNNNNSSIIGRSNFRHHLQQELGGGGGGGGPRNSNTNNININNYNNHQYRHRRGQSLTSAKDPTADDNNHRLQLDLFSKHRPTLSIASNSDDSSDVSVKLSLGRLSVGSAKLAKPGIDDLLTSCDGGKHDYDWLLTPPGTPLFSSSDASESRPTSAAPRSTTLARSVSTTKASRLSVSQTESYHSSRPTRSSSVTRSSISSSQFSTYSSNRSSSILNTSSASVSSYTRPSSPITRSPSTARPSTPSARPTPSHSRSSTPSRIRAVPTSSSTDKARPSPNSRPSTPSSRSQIPANLNSANARSSSRPSTPTRRNSAPSVTPSSVSLTSASLSVSNGRISGPPSRPSSPGPRVRPSQQPVVPPDFPLDTPPNLRTTLPDRPLSAGRSRPGAAVTMKVSPETSSPANVPRRHSSPVVTRGRLTEPPGKGRVLAHGHASSDARKPSHVPELGTRKPVKSSSTATDSTGIGRTISKKSLDMAIRHMDIRNGTGTNRPLSGTTLFPQSIRSAASKSLSARSMSSVESVDSYSNGSVHNGDILENGSHISAQADIRTEVSDRRYSAKLSEVDIYESSRYDTMLLKEDLKNTNWLHSIDDKSDEALIFDNGFMPLPEPFGLL